MKIIPKYQLGSSIDNLNLSPPKELQEVAQPDNTKVSLPNMNIESVLIPKSTNSSLPTYDVIDFGVDRYGNFKDSYLNQKIKNFEGRDFGKQLKARRLFSTYAKNNIPSNMNYLTPTQQRALIDTLYTLSPGGVNYNKRVNLLRSLNPNNAKDVFAKLKEMITTKNNSSNRNNWRIQMWDNQDNNS